MQGQRETRERRTARVAAMTGVTCIPTTITNRCPSSTRGSTCSHRSSGSSGCSVPRRSSVVTTRCSLARLVVGAAFLGAVSDAMLLGHWYLVQPGLGREPIKEMVKAVAVLWPFELVVYLIPVGMVSVLNGTVDDGYGGLMGWMWIVASVTTIGLVIATWFALKERSYSAVMAATGLMYLAILTGFGMDLLPRALLS